MKPTSYPHVNALLDHLLVDLQVLLGSKLIGLYLYGSLVIGDFDEDISDVDLLAAISEDLAEAEFEALDRMHGDLAAAFPAWQGRIEIAYLSRHALKTFRTHTSRIAVISPGEPFHFKDAGKDWLVNWYMVREKGVTLFGPPPEVIIDPISKDEFIQDVKDHMAAWRQWIDDMRDGPGQAYAILTMCRGLYTCTHGEQVPKLRAALWAEQHFPAWSPLIRKALRWRRRWPEDDGDKAGMLADARRFVLFVLDQIPG